MVSFNKFHSLIAVLIFGFTSVVQAAPFSLVDQQTGITYQCGGAQPGNGAGVPNTQCIQDLTSYCYSNTSLTRDQCFQALSNNNGCYLTGYTECVRSTQSYCYSNTSMTRDQCFNHALASCRGGSSIELMNAVAVHAEKKAEKKFQLELKQLKNR